MTHLHWKVCDPLIDVFWQLLAKQVFSLSERKIDLKHKNRKEKDGTNRNQDTVRFGKDLLEGVDIFQTECLALQMEHSFVFQFCKLPITTLFQKIMMVIKKSHKSACFYRLYVTRWCDSDDMGGFKVPIHKPYFIWLKFRQLKVRWCLKETAGWRNANHSFWCSNPNALHT